MTRIRPGEETGFAMITAVLVTAIVLMLSVSAFAVAIHNTEASGYDKRRLMAIDAAEAGVDYYYQLIGSNSFSALPTAAMPAGWTINSSTCVLTGSLSTTPTSSFTVTPSFYASSSSTTAHACPLSSAADGSSLTAINANGPWYVELKSQGSVTNATAPVRIMRSRARISTTGSGLVFPAAAMIGNVNVAFNANVQVYGNGSNNADVYSTGNFSVTTQSNIKGNMYVQGTLNIANGNFQLSGDAWAKNAVTVSGGVIGRDVISSTSTVSLSGNTTINRNAEAGSTISVQNPASVLGTQSPSTSGISDPPSQTYPAYTYNSNDWPGITSVSTCSAVQTAINNWTTGNLYLRLTGAGISGSVCSLTLSPSTKSMPGNLAVLTDGGLTMPTPTKLVNGDASGTTHTVYFVTGLVGGTVDTASGCTTSGNFTANANSGIGSNLNVLVFTPKSCTTTIKSNSFNGAGQLFSGTVSFESNSTFTYSPIHLPTETSDKSSYLIDIVYKREVTS